MATRKPEIDKHYYSISEVAELFQVNASLIRYWENEFDSIKPYKNKKGTRFFTKENIEEVELVYHLVKERGMTLKGAKQKIKENKEDVIHEHKIVARLRAIRSMLLEIKEEL